MTVDSFQDDRMSESESRSRSDSSQYLRDETITKEAEILISARKTMTRDQEATDDLIHPVAHKVPIQSMNFEETENYVWRLHQTRRFYTDIGTYWNATRRSTAYKWILVVLIGAVIGCMGVLVRVVTGRLTEYKFGTVLAMYDNGNHVGAYFVLLALCLFYAGVACVCAIIEPNAAGSGLPEIKAFLNGINLNKVVRFQIVIFKIIGMCFICAAGLPLGKEGPMIHCGAVFGAALSQGKTFLLGLNTTWTKLQDLRNDRAKRDYVTFGAAAGVAAAFSAPVGGVLFALEEGASFWSPTVTFRAFFCAMIAQLLITTLLVVPLGKTQNPSVFPFGNFPQKDYFPIQELFVFAFVGIMGGILGALFNHFTKLITVFRQKYVNDLIYKRIAEVALITTVFTTLAFASSVGWNECAPLPENVGADDDMYSMNANRPLFHYLIPLQCDKETEWNPMATLWLNEGNTAMRELFHMPKGSFTAPCLLGFAVPYFLFASIITGGLYPAGLFVPTLLSGAALGRLFGHAIAQFAPNSTFSDEGTYALLGAAAMMGGMSRMTIAGTVILLEACGNHDYLLPLMLTFAAARYTGNAINQPLYDMMIDLKALPFLEGSLGGLGLLNYHNVASVMAQPVVTLQEINKVRAVSDLLKRCSHNGFPVVAKDGRLRGLILRKTLCTMLKLKAFSKPIFDENSEEAQSVRRSSMRKSSMRSGSTSAQLPPTPKGEVMLSNSVMISYDALERTYPKYPQIDEVDLSEEDMRSWLDLRNYMETAPFTMNENASVSRCYRLFRTMGLRHLILTNEQHEVTGIITRHDITEHKLAHDYRATTDNIRSYYSAHRSDPAYISEREALMEEKQGDFGDLGNDDPDDPIQATLSGLRREAGGAFSQREKGDGDGYSPTRESFERLSDHGSHHTPSASLHHRGTVGRDTVTRDTLASVAEDEGARPM